MPGARLGRVVRPRPGQNGEVIDPIDNIEASGAARRYPGRGGRLRRRGPASYTAAARYALWRDWSGRKEGQSNQRESRVDRLEFLMTSHASVPSRRQIFEIAGFTFRYCPSISVPSCLQCCWVCRPNSDSNCFISLLGVVSSAFDSLSSVMIVGDFSPRSIWLT